MAVIIPAPTLLDHTPVAATQDIYLRLMKEGVSYYYRYTVFGISIIAFVKVTILMSVLDPKSVIKCVTTLWDRFSVDARQAMC